MIFQRPALGAYYAEVQSLPINGLGAYYAERENLPISGLGVNPDGLGGCVPCGAYTEQARAADEEFMRRNRPVMVVGSLLFFAMIGGLFWAASRP